MAGGVAESLEGQSDQKLPGSSCKRVLDPEILTSFLEGSSWVESFEAFFVRHCDVFATFHIGAEYSLQQTHVHIQFVSSAEALLDGRLAELAVSPDSLLSQLMADAATSKAAAAAMRYLEACIDFEQFGLMMRQRSDALSSQIHRLEQYNDCLQEQIDTHKRQQQAIKEDKEFMREQQAIREASERRRRAREDAMRRAAESDSLEPEPQPEPEQSGSAREDADTCSSWESHPARIVGPILPQNGWEMGQVEQGIVSYWDDRRGWGKIQRMALPTVDHGSDDCRPPQSATKIGVNEIFVHNLQLPMDAPRRWLRPGEMVEFTVGATVVPRGPQACAVVGLSAGTHVPLLCQKHAPSSDI